MASDSRFDLRFELPPDLTPCFEMVMPIRWGDMDAFGHVNNTVYFRYLESLRIEWLRSLEGAEPLGAEGTGPVIVNAFCNFYRQLTFPGDILAKQYLGVVGRSSVDIYGTLERVDEPGVIVAAGGAKTVWVHYAQQKSQPLPERLKRAATPPVQSGPLLPP
ncbi:acyl-CoA thioesterase [Leptothrix ochracea]|uniref:acyl-CoA thioesterase n=1 Tax=Leptothrix ochracea TaxID=735331 RepID=UPI0034E2B733